jgi:hypothetical protein
VPTSGVAQSRAWIYFGNMFASEFGDSRFQHFQTFQVTYVHSPPNNVRREACPHVEVRLLRGWRCECRPAELHCSGILPDSNASDSGSATIGIFCPSGHTRRRRNRMPTNGQFQPPNPKKVESASSHKKSLAHRLLPRPKTSHSPGYTTAPNTGQRGPTEVACDYPE